MLKTEGMPVTAGTPITEGTPTTVVTLGEEGMSTTAGPQQPHKRQYQHYAKHRRDSTTKETPTT